MAISNENAALLERHDTQLLQMQADVLTLYLQERESSGCDQVALAQTMADLQAGLWKAQKALIELRGTL